LLAPASLTANESFRDAYGIRELLSPGVGTESRRLREGSVSGRRSRADKKEPESITTKKLSEICVVQTV